MRKLMWFALGFAGACALGAYCYVPWLMAGTIVFALMGALCAFLANRWQFFRVGCAICLGAIVGLLWFGCYDGILLREARNADGETVNLSIRAVDYSYRTQYGSAVDGEAEIGGRTYRIRAYLDKPRELVPGDWIQGEFRLRLTTNGGSEDPVYHQGYGVFLLAYQESESVTDWDGAPKWKDYPAIWRSKITDRINAAFPEDTEGFARALLLGDRTGVDYKMNTAFRLSGISHIIAVSGLHVSILFGLIYLLLGRRRLLTALVGIPMLLLFAAIAGFTPSITRACIMQAIMILAMLFGREYDQMTSLAFAALAMLTVNPMVITSVSFQLSAGCMAGIFLYGEKIRLWLMDASRLGRWKGNIVNWLSGSLSITFSAMVFTTPLVAIYFGTVSLIGALTNLLTLWVVAYIFYGILLVCVIGFVSSGAAAFLGSLISLLIRFVLWITSTLAAFPLAAVYTKSVYIVAWLILAYLLLGIYLICKEKPAALFSAMVTGGLILALILSWTEPMLDQCRFTMLDVGQGQAILLQTEGKTFLVDCGGNNSEDAADITADTLLSQGIRRLDGIFVTHYDKDHAGGLEYLLTRIQTEKLFLPHALDEEQVADQLIALSGAEAHRVTEDTQISFGDAAITLFAPISYNSGNESSMCILFQTKKCDILITGDCGMASERILLERHDLPDLDVLVAGHHGSKNSTSRELLEVTRPEYVFISVSKGNPYGHPAREMLDRLAEYGCAVFRTDQNGMILFRR